MKKSHFRAFAAILFASLVLLPSCGVRKPYHPPAAEEGSTAQTEILSSETLTAETEPAPAEDPAYALVREAFEKTFSGEGRHHVVTVTMEMPVKTDGGEKLLQGKYVLETAILKPENGEPELEEHAVETVTFGEDVQEGKIDLFVLPDLVYYRESPDASYGTFTRSSAEGSYFRSALDEMLEEEMKAPSDSLLDGAEVGEGRNDCFSVTPTRKNAMREYDTEYLFSFLSLFLYGMDPEVEEGHLTDLAVQYLVTRDGFLSAESASAEVLLQIKLGGVFNRTTAKIAMTMEYPDPGAPVEILPPV